MFHFGRSKPHTPSDGVLPRDLPRPGVLDPVRAFAYDAARSATNSLWLRLTGPLLDATPPLLTALPELGDSGIRWTGAGVLPAARAEWWAFDGGDACSSMVLFTGDPLEVERLALTFRRTLPDAVAHMTLPGRPIPRPVLEHAAAARAVPVWELAGFARLAPRGLLESGFATIAA